MSVCTFFGHSDCYGLDESVIEGAIEDLIKEGFDTFYVGHQGRFDSIVFSSLSRLKEIHTHISFSVVLAYLPTENVNENSIYKCSIFPEAVEKGPARFAIERRNKWLIANSDCCLCYITRSFGGAYKFAKQAKNKGLKIINIGDLSL